MNVTFCGYKCNIKVERYMDGSPAIKLVASEFVEEDAVFPGTPVATATVCLDNWLLSDGEVLIKAYSENTGMVEALVEGGLIQKPHMHLDLSRTAGSWGPKRVFDPAEARTYVAVCRFTPAAVSAFPDLASEEEEEEVQE